MGLWMAVSVSNCNEPARTRAKQLNFRTGMARFDAAMMDIVVPFVEVDFDFDFLELLTTGW